VSTPHIIKPLRFIKSRIPSLPRYTNAALLRAHDAAQHTYLNAKRSAAVGRGDVVQATARRVLAGLQ
jgi:hypothetical protein